MECLDEETILAFCQGNLAPAGGAAAEAHIETCDECRALVSAVVRSSFVEPRAPRAPLEASTPEVSLGRDAAAAAAAFAPTGVVELSSGAEAPVRPGDVVEGKFRIDRILGSGGMGVVVAARHIHLDQRVAMKFLLPSAFAAHGAVARFLREGRAAARITSEHVARVMDTGVLDGNVPYLVMEYLEGRDLAAELFARGQLPADEAVALVLQACEAIAEAHTLGIVHRDLKPQNLFLTRRADGSPLVKVLDFGISKVEGSSRSVMTSDSVLMGSPRYMSPEQMLSAKDVDARTDVWALGVILFELVAGQPVWNADTLQGLCALIVSAPAPSLREISPSASPELADVVARCLMKTPDDRIPSVAELALALTPIAPLEARPSIERILGIAGRSRSVQPPAPARPSSRAPAPAPLEPVAARSVRRPAWVAGVGFGLLTAIAAFGLVFALTRSSVMRRGERPIEAATELAPPTSPMPSGAPSATAAAASGALPTTVASAATGAPASETATGAPAETATAAVSTGATTKPSTAERRRPLGVRATADASVAPARAGAPASGPSNGGPSRPVVDPDRALLDRK